MTAPELDDKGFIVPPPHGWHCFHCGESFASTLAGQREAELHFGPTPDHTPECIERTTLTAREVMRRYRKALRSTQQAWARVHEAEEAEEVARGQASAWRERFKTESALDAWSHHQDLRLRAQDHDAYMRELHRQAPDVFLAVYVAVAGPGEYFPPPPPTTES